MNRVPVVSPAGAEPKSTEFVVAARPQTLARRRLAVLDNGKPNAGYVMASLARGLRQRHGMGDVAHSGKAVAARPCPDEVLTGFRGFDAAIVGVGD